MPHPDQPAHSRAIAAFRGTIAAQGAQLDGLMERAAELRALALQAEGAMRRADHLRELAARASEAERTIQEKDRLIERLWRDKNAQAGELERYAQHLERTLADKNRHLEAKDQHILRLEEAIRRVDRSIPVRLYRVLRRRGRPGGAG